VNISPPRQRVFEHKWNSDVFVDVGAGGHGSSTNIVVSPKVVNLFFTV
jgi:hypothetical protein